MAVSLLIFLFKKSSKGDIELKFWQKFFFSQNQVIKFHLFWGWKGDVENVNIGIFGSYILNGFIQNCCQLSWNMLGEACHYYSINLKKNSTFDISTPHPLSTCCKQYVDELRTILYALILKSLPSNQLAFTQVLSFDNFVFSLSLGYI